MGAVMGSKNLRAIVVRARNADKVAFADPEGLKRLAALVERLKTAEFPATLKAHGTPGIVGFQSDAAIWLLIITAPDSIRPYESGWRYL